MQPTSIERERLAKLGWNERYVSANGVRFHIAEAGPSSAPLVMLLHGFPECFLSWRFQLGALADRYHVVAPDLRGYNLTEKPSYGYDIATLATDVRELILTLGEKQADVVGHDWGGVIAWAVALREPEVVRRLVILNAPHPAVMIHELRHPRQMIRSSYVAFFQLRGIAERIISRNDFALLRRTFRTADPGAAWLTNEDIQHFVDAIAQPGALSAALEYYRQLRRSLPQLSPFRIITSPTLVLWGELDPYLGPELVDHLKPWVRELTIQRFPATGHWLNQQEPERVNEALLAFFTGSSEHP